ncbi:MAG: hypothetical protein HYW88_01950, partial [Candidatus Sungbacteria bacterium]|nr:hypothetical protein [Candidatus Sungbacteria bacterium]
AVPATIEEVVKEIKGDGKPGRDVILNFVWPNTDGMYRGVLMITTADWRSERTKEADMLKEKLWRSSYNLQAEVDFKILNTMSRVMQDTNFSTHKETEKFLTALRNEWFKEWSVKVTKFEEGD